MTHAHGIDGRVDLAHDADGRRRPVVSGAEVGDGIPDKGREVCGRGYDGELAVRKACTLGMSFDHRIIDGDLGAAVLRDVGAMLSDPLRMLAWS